MKPGGQAELSVHSIRSYPGQAALEAVASLAQGGGRDSATVMVTWMHFANRCHRSECDGKMIFVMNNESKCLRLSIAFRPSHVCKTGTGTSGARR